MASPVDTSVKFYREDFPGSPVLNGVAGSLIGVLDACLCTGFGLRTAESLVVSGGVATLTLSSDVKNGNLLNSVVLVDGSSITALNGEQRVTFASGTELKFATAATNGTATGTITVKTAPAGWEKKYTGTNLAVFKSLDVTSLGAHLWVNDAGTRDANVRMYENMTDVNTGTGAAPTTVQSAQGGFWLKSSIANVSANRWDLFADSRAFYYCPVPGSGTTFSQIGQASYFFGDILAFKSGDVFATLLFAPNAAATNNIHYGNVFYGGQSPSNSINQFLRAYTGLGASVAGYAMPFSGAAVGSSGADATQGNFPAPTDGGLRLSRMYATEAISSGTGTILRGEMPGVHYCPQTGVGAFFARGDTVPLGGRKLYAVHVSSSVSDVGSEGGRGFVDITGPWR